MECGHLGRWDFEPLNPPEISWLVEMDLHPHTKKSDFPCRKIVCEVTDLTNAGQ